MSSTRVLLLIDLYPPFIGGAETHAAHLAEALVARGLELTVLTRQFQPELPAEEQPREGLRILRLPDPPGGTRWAKYSIIPAFLKELRARKDEYDLLYVCGFRVLGWPICGLAKQLNTPVLLREEVLGELSGAFIWEQPGRGERAALKMLFRPLVQIRNRRLKKRAHFLSISSAVEEEFLEAGVPKERIRSIANGIDTNKFKPADPEKRGELRRELSLPQGELLFIYTGKLNQGKGLQLLLQVWKRWVAEGQPGHLLLVGAGGGQWLSCEQELKDFVEQEQLKERVTFAGYQQQVLPFLQCADVFVFASEAESFGLAPLEANACGLPAVSTDAGALAETVPDMEAGLSVPTGDADAFYQGMKRLAEDAELRVELGRKASERVRRLYGFDAIAEQHLQAFAALTEAR